MEYHFSKMHYVLIAQSGIRNLRYVIVTATGSCQALSCSFRMPELNRNSSDVMRNGLFL